MPINVFGNSNSNINGDKIDTSLFVQKPFLRTFYIEANIEEDIDLKNQFGIKILAHPISIREAASKNYVDEAIFLGVNESLLLRLHPDVLSNLDERDYILLDSTVTPPWTTFEIPNKNYVDCKFDDPSIMKNNVHADLNNRNITNALFIQVNQWPQIDSHLTPKFYVDNIDEQSVVRNNQDNDFSKYNLTIIKSNTLNTQAVNDNQVITKAYVDQYQQEDERSRRDVGLDFYDESNDLVKNNQDNDFNDNKLINLDSVGVNREPTSDNELANKTYIDDELDKNTVLRFNQTLEKYLKVSVGIVTYNLTKYNKIQLTDTTNMKSGKNGGYSLQNWNIKCNDKNNNEKISKFIKSTKINSPSSHSGATSLPPIGNAFMYIERSSNNHGSSVFVSWERTVIIQITNIIFYYNRFSFLTDDSLKNMSRFRIQL